MSHLHSEEHAAPIHDQLKTRLKAVEAWQCMELKCGATSRENALDSPDPLSMHMLGLRLREKTVY